MRWTEGQLRDHQARMNRPVPDRRPLQLLAQDARPTQYRSKAEMRYAEHLQMLLRSGDIVAWQHEPIRLKLADGCWYKPDFLITHRAGQLQAVEVKGFMREAARVRLRVAARLYPWLPFVIAWARRGGAFEHEAVNP